MRRNQNQRRQLNVEQLNAIAQGQQRRTVLDVSSLMTAVTGFNLETSLY